MGTHAGSVMTLANSIIGVSVLAMPYCFKQCGIVLSIVMLITSNVVTRLACYYLVKSAIMEKRKNFEMLAFRVLGPSGKLVVELCIIGFMLGTCVAFFVVVGDLGPTILAEVIGVEHPSALRPSVLIGVSVFVVLPLGLLRNVESLSTLCAASIGFYFCLVLKVMGESMSHLMAGDWMDKVEFWRPAGLLRCIPIFSMALSCQTQLFEVFDSLPSTPLDRINSIIRSAINMTTTFYIAVGFFGYVAFCNQQFTGNLLINFSPSVVSYVIKLGFVMSVAVSFPLVIFPCRASIYSLVFNKGVGGQSEGSAHMPETTFQCITLLIVTLSLVTGLLVPSIEIVLSFIGSTIGVFVCVILPSVIFISLSSKDTTEKFLAKVLAGAGLLTMVLSTYANFYSGTEGAIVGLQDLPSPVKERLESIPIAPKNILPPTVGEVKFLDPEIKDVALPEVKVEEIKESVDKSDTKESRQEPPIPVPEEPKPRKRNEDKLAEIISKLEQELAKDKASEADKQAQEKKLAETTKPEPVKPPDQKNPQDTVNSQPVIKANLSAKTETKSTAPKGSLAESMVNGVPLPLAIKGTGDVKEREKRDVEVTSPMKQDPAGEKTVQAEPVGVPALPALPDVKKIQEGSSQQEKTDLPVNNIAVKTDEIKVVNKIKESENNVRGLKDSAAGKGEESFMKVVETEVKALRNEENCPQNKSEEEPVVVVNEIKTPAYLSEPGLILDTVKAPPQQKLQPVPESFYKRVEHR